MGHRRDPVLRASYVETRGKGGFVRANWDEATEITAAANAYTRKPTAPTGSSASRRSRRCRWSATLPARVTSAAGRHLHVVLRLVLRPAAGQPADLGRTDRRAGIGGLVQRRLPAAVGLERAADAHARRAFLHRGALPRHQVGGHLPRLFRGLQVRRHLAGAATGHRRGAGDGHGPCHPARVPPRPAGGLFRGLLPQVHRHADAGEA